MGFIVVGFYTENTGYAKEADNLIQSLKKFDLTYDIVSTPNQGSWQANTQYKAYFIKEMLHRHYPKDLLYLDVDAVVQRRPDLFDVVNFDIGVHYKDNRELVSSTIYFANNAKIAFLINRWIEACIKNPTIWDQKVLQAVINNSKDLNLKVMNLPPQYCKIFDLMAAIKDPVIEQFQASRRLRAEIDYRDK